MALKTTMTVTAPDPGARNPSPAACGPLPATGPDVAPRGRRLVSRTPTSAGGSDRRQWEARGIGDRDQRP